MKNPSVRATTFLLLLVALLAFAGCAEDRPPPTRNEVIWACGTFNLEACQTFGRCLGWDAARVQQCVNEENAKCARDLEAESCWENQRDALEECADRVAGESCEAACNNSFCGANCPYFCPQ